MALLVQSYKTDEDPRIAALEQRVAVLEGESKRNWRVIGQLHNYMQRIYDALKAGASVILAFDYAILKPGDLGEKKQWGKGASPEEVARYEELGRLADRLQGKLKR